MEEMKSARKSTGQIPGYGFLQIVVVLDGFAHKVTQGLHTSYIGIKVKVQGYGFLQIVVALGELHKSHREKKKSKGMEFFQSWNLATVQQQMVDLMIRRIQGYGFLFEVDQGYGLLPIVLPGFEK